VLRLRIRVTGIPEPAAGSRATGPSSAQRPLHTESDQLERRPALELDPPRRPPNPLAATAALTSLIQDPTARVPRTHHSLVNNTITDRVTAAVARDQGQVPTLESRGPREFLIYLI
jgi:hypothetical protein